MKRILAVAILLASFCALASSARAESNPLLTIFEAINVGTNGTLFRDVREAVHAYQKKDPYITAGIGLYDENRIFMSWTWIDPAYAGTLLAPTARLEIVLDPRLPDRNKRIVSAHYTYSFLDFTKELRK